MKLLLVDAICLIVAPLAFLLGCEPDFCELSVNLFHAFSEHRRGQSKGKAGSLSDDAAPGFVSKIGAGLVALIVLSACGQIHAQAPDSVQLTWQPSSSQCVAVTPASCQPGTGETLVNVYRAALPSAKTCVAVTSWTQIATAIAPSGPYTDNPGVGSWCYVVRSYFVGDPVDESKNSNIAFVSVLPVAPTALKATTP